MFVFHLLKWCTSPFHIPFHSMKSLQKFSTQLRCRTTVKVISCHHSFSWSWFFRWQLWGRCFDTQISRYLDDPPKKGVTISWMLKQPFLQKWWFFLHAQPGENRHFNEFWGECSEWNNLSLHTNAGNPPVLHAGKSIHPSYRNGSILSSYVIVSSGDTMATLRSPAKG